MIPSFSRGVIPLVFSLLYLTPFVSRATDCYYTGTTAAMTSKQSIDLTTVFQTSTTYSTSFSTNFSQTLKCSGKTLDTVKFFTQGSKPYYVNFTDSAGTNNYWVKITTEISPSTKQMNSPVSQTARSMSDYQARITLTAELVATPSGTLTYTTSTTSGTALIPIAAALLPEFGQDEYDIQAQRDNFSSAYIYAVQRLNVTYSPPAMTCEVKDQTVNLPTTGINDLLEGNYNGKHAFTLPLSCDSETGLALSNVNVWLMSNDIVDSENKVLRNEESSSTGVGISLQDENGADITLSSTNTLTNATSKIKTISKGESVEDGEQDVTLNAYYKVFDSANVHAGSVRATATVMFGYD